MAYNLDDSADLSIAWLEGLAEVERPSNVGEDALCIPLTTEIHQLAELCAEQQKTPEKRAQVRRNILAVLAVHEYLRFQSYSLDLAASGCWNSIRRRLEDIADLVVSGIGRLECRVFEADQELCLLPEEVQIDRVGYVGVQFDVEGHWAWLLGFAPALSTTEPVEGIRRAELRSMDEFGAHLHRLRLFQEILSEKAEQTDEPWEPELRDQIVAQLERVILLEADPYRYSEFANREIAPLMGLEATESGQLVEHAREPGVTAHQESGSAMNLDQFLQEIFDELNDRLAEE